MLGVCLEVACGRLHRGELSRCPTCQQFSTWGQHLLPLPLESVWVSGFRACGVEGGPTSALPGAWGGLVWRAAGHHKGRLGPGEHLQPPPSLGQDLATGRPCRSGRASGPWILVLDLGNPVPSKGPAGQSPAPAPSPGPTHSCCRVAESPRPTWGAPWHHLDLRLPSEPGREAAPPPAHPGSWVPVNEGRGQLPWTAHVLAHTSMLTCVHVFTCHLQP